MVFCVHTTLCMCTPKIDISIKRNKTHTQKFFFFFFKVSYIIMIPEHEASNVKHDLMI